MMKDSQYKWFALGLLWVAYFLDLGLRQIYGATLPAIQSSFGTGAAEIGLVGSFFAITVGVAAPFSGLVSDLCGRKWVVTAAVAVMGLGILASGFATGVAVLAITYGILFGAGQSFVYAPTSSIVSQLFREKRATAISLVQLALYAGIILFSFAGGAFADLGADGWRRAFVIGGAAALVWAFVLAFLLRNTRPEAPAGGTDAKPTIREALSAVVSKPSALMYCAYLGLMLFVFIGYSTWTPTFLREKFPEMSLKDAALHSVLWHYLGAAIGVMIGSRAGDRLKARRPSIRLEITVFGILGSIPSIVLLVKSPTLAVCSAALFAYGVFRGFFDSNLYASLFDVIKPRFHATAMGLSMGFGYGIASLAPWGLGLVREHFSMQAGFLLFAWVYALAIVLIFISRALFLKRDSEV